MSEARRVARYDDLLELPDHLVGEIVDGQVVASSRPAPAHSRAEGRIFAALTFLFDHAPGPGPGPGGWWLLVEPELHLADDVLVPDVAGWERTTLPRFPDAAAIDVAPDWVCEVTSPRTRRHDRIVKLDCYARHGVRHVWIVDPLDQTLEVFTRSGAGWLRVAAFDGRRLVRAAPFEAVELDIGRWWTEPGP